MYYRFQNKIIETDGINVDFAEFGGVGNVMFQNMQKHGDKVAQVSPFLILFFFIEEQFLFIRFVMDLIFVRLK